MAEKVFAVSGMTGGRSVGTVPDAGVAAAVAGAGCAVIEGAAA